MWCQRHIRYRSWKFYSKQTEGHFWEPLEPFVHVTFGTIDLRRCRIHISRYRVIVSTDQILKCQRHLQIESSIRFPHSKFSFQNRQKVIQGKFSIERGVVHATSDTINLRRGVRKKNSNPSADIPEGYYALPSFNTKKISVNEIRHSIIT